DDCCPQTPNGDFVVPNDITSRGLVLKLDTTKYTATVVTQYIRSKGFLAAFLGNTELLGNGGAVVGWGSQPFFSEFSKSGKMVLDATFPAPDQSYRTYVERWKGFPSYRPDGGVKKHGSQATVYASWNGSTEVKKWGVLC